MKVSIIVLSYNSEKTILTTLQSIEKQSFTDYEVIISDDCSKDKTVSLCLKWKNKNWKKNIKILEAKKNQGITKNINKAIKVAKGEWVKLIAADDILLKNCIRDNVEFVEKSKNINICFSNAIIFGSKVKRKKIFIDKKFYLLNSHEQYKKLLSNNLISAPTSFIKKNIFKKYGFYDERIRDIEDWPMWLKITKQGEKLYFFDKTTVLYRKEESMSNSNILIINERYLKAKCQVYNYYLKNNINILKKWSFYHELILYNLTIKIFGNKLTKKSYLFIKILKLLDPLSIKHKIKILIERRNFWGEN